MVQCACGTLGVCQTEGSDCNCDGSDKTKLVDYGRIVDKDVLPVTLVAFGGLTGRMKASFYVSPLHCGPKQVGRLRYNLDSFGRSFSSSFEGTLSLSSTLKVHVSAYA